MRKSNQTVINEIVMETYGFACTTLTELFLLTMNGAINMIKHVSIQVADNEILQRRLDYIAEM